MDNFGRSQESNGWIYLSFINSALYFVIYETIIGFAGIYWKIESKKQEIVLKFCMKLWTDSERASSTMTQKLSNRKKIKSFYWHVLHIIRYAIWIPYWDGICVTFFAFCPFINYSKHWSKYQDYVKDCQLLRKCISVEFIFPKGEK